MHKNFYSGVSVGIFFAVFAVASTAGAQAPAAGPAKPTSPAAQPSPVASQPAPATAQPAPAAAAAPAACTAAVRGDSIQILPTPVAVDAAITQAIGDSVKAEFPAESKIVVSAAATDPAAPQIVKLTLDTSAAAPGEWTLNLKGTAGGCNGKVRITAK